jgi:triacylglycerol lipase
MADDTSFAADDRILSPVTTHVMLVPGFFGFVNFGRLMYFAHVCEVLEREFQARGVDVVIHRVRTHPVASLRQRARDLHHEIARLTDDGPVHVIGHSSGGLDARLLTSPGVDLGSGLAHADIESVAERICSVTTLCTPHLGSPLAGHLAGLVGEPLLRTVSILTVLGLRRGRVPVHLALRFARALIGERLLPETPIHVVLETLESEAMLALQTTCQSEEDRLSVADFMRELRAKPHLIPQLMPPALDLFNAGIIDRPTTHYNCVIARCPAPSLRSQLRVSGSAYHHMTHLFFQWLHPRSSAANSDFRVDFDETQRQIMLAAWGELASERDNDGMVPTISQVHGRIVHAATADHLDVIGHLNDPQHDPPHHDWISSGSCFGRVAFETMWHDVVDALCESE